MSTGHTAVSPFDIRSEARAVCRGAILRRAALEPWRFRFFEWVLLGAHMFVEPWVSRLLHFSDYAFMNDGTVTPLKRARLATREMEHRPRWSAVHVNTRFC